ncbi:hypothetical protein FQN52_003079, partial [Onygenales sp. PD_12]
IPETLQFFSSIKTTMATQLPVLLISGANQGLGYHASQILARGGEYIILLGSRDPAKGQEAVKKIRQNPSTAPSTIIEPIQLDVNSDESIASAVEYVSKTYGKLDILINNAAYSDIRQESEGGPSLRQIYRDQFETNFVSQGVMTDRFLPLLRKGSTPRIVFTSSGLGSFAIASDPDSGPTKYLYMGYRSTKSALNMLALTYANILKEDGITVVIVCPGFCATNLNDYAGILEPSVGAEQIVKAATNGTHDEVSGTWVSEGGIMPW